MIDLNIEMIEQDVCGSFWTRRGKMIAEIEDKGYPVDEDFGEFLVIRESEDEDAAEYKLLVGNTGRTLWIEKVEEGN